MRRRQFITLIAQITAWLGMGCVPQPGTQQATPLPSDQDLISLPEPRRQGPVSLEETLQERRSIRSFTEQSLSQEELGQLLWAAQGITADWGGRTAPSAGALYPLETYAITAEGCYHYDPANHQLVQVAKGDLRTPLWEAALRQDSVRQAAVNILLTKVLARTQVRYGDRAPLYVHLEAGHAAQNVLLQAVALGLGAVPIGAFYEDRLQRDLPLPEEHFPLYLIPVGRPA